MYFQRRIPLFTPMARHNPSTMKFPSLSGIIQISTIQWVSNLSQFNYFNPGTLTGFLSLVNLSLYSFTCRPIHTYPLFAIYYVFKQKAKGSTYNLIIHAPAFVHFIYS